MGSLTNDEFTSRTDYLVNGPQEIFLFLSGRDEGQNYDDYAFMARSDDGGRTFAFLSRVNPWGDPARGVMPSLLSASMATVFWPVCEEGRSAMPTSMEEMISAGSIATAQITMDSRGITPPGLRKPDITTGIHLRW